MYRFEGHGDDVNAVTFVDNKCNIILSGSDDSLIKVCIDLVQAIQSGTYVASFTKDSCDNRRIDKAWRSFF